MIKKNNIVINIEEKKYGKDFFNFLKNIIEGKNINYPEEKYADMPYLETEEEAAENIADIHERQNNTRIKDNARKKDDTRKKDNTRKKDDTKKKMIQEKRRIMSYRNGLNINGIKKRYPKKKS